MITVESKSAADAIKKNFNFLSASKLREITSVSINKTLLKSRTQLSKNVMNVFNIDKGTFLNGTRIQKAKSSYGKQYGYLLSSAHPLNISNFGARQVAFGKLTEFIGKKRGKNRGGYASKNIPINDAGVYLEVYAGKEERLPSAFMMFFSNGNAAIMARGQDSKGRFSFTQPRLPIDGLTSKSISSMIYNPKVKSHSQEEISGLFVNEMHRQLQKEITKMHSHVF